MTNWISSGVLNRSVQDWQDREVIDEATANALKLDINQRKNGVSFLNVVALLAVVCIGFAAMTFVAANWEEMARLS